MPRRGVRRGYATRAMERVSDPESAESLPSAESHGLRHALIHAEHELVRACREEGKHLGELVAERDPFWPAQVTILAAIVLYVTLPEKLTLGPNWFLPSLEGLLFIGLIVAMPHPAMQYSPRRRQVAVVLTGLVSLANLISLVLLAHYLLKGGKAGGHQLILSGVVLWLTNVLIFAVWYWEIDRGGPVARVLDPGTRADFLFPQMSEPEWSAPGWRPAYIDYLYTSFTNATAFSPTDTMPLTPVAKTLMMVQSVAALVTIGLVVSRAVNILS